MYKLPPHATIYQAEGVAISKGAQWAKSQNPDLDETSRKFALGDFDLGSDSRSVLSSVRSSENRSRLVAKCILPRLEQHTQLFWLPSHVGHKGNELADWLANQARTWGTSVAVPIPKGYTCLAARNRSLKVWQERWSKLPSNKPYRLFAPELDNLKQIWKRKFSSSGLTQLFTGHSWLQEHQYRFRFSVTDRCKNCKHMVAESVDHFLFHCPRWERQRMELENCLPDTTTMTYSSLMRFPNGMLRFCNSTGRLRNKFRKEEK